MKDAKTIIVDKCCECPFTDTFGLDDWSEYQCILDDREHDIPGNTETPPDWCPLRKLVVMVSLTMEL
jgi:hypothetical protein